MFKFSKYIFLVAALVLGFSYASQAQISGLEVVEETRSMSKGSYNALVLKLTGTTEKEVLKEWSRFVKDYGGKTKYDKKGGEYFTDNATVKEMSDNTIDIYMKVTPSGEDLILSAWFNLGVTYLSSNEHPDRYPAAEEMMKTFSLNVSAAMIEADLKLKEQELKDLEKEQKDLEKDKANREKDIASYEETIRKMETNIDTAKTDIEENEKQQGEQKKKIDEKRIEIEEIKRLLNKVQSK